MPPFSTPSVYGSESFKGSYNELYYKVNSHTYDLPVNLDIVENYRSIKNILNDEASKLLSNNGFVVLSNNYTDLDDTYEYFINSGYPIYISTDTVLYLYHTLFDKILAILEENISSDSIYSRFLWRLNIL